MKTQIDLFNAFFRIGIFGFGGGPTMIPLVHKEVVERYKWMEDEEFSNTLAIGNMLPGPIATKMAGYIGYRVAGTMGCINAVLATIIPIVVAMILVMTLFNEYRDLAWVSGMAMGVIPIVSWMMVKLTWDFYIKGQKGLGILLTLAMAASSIALIELVGVHPGLIIASVLIAVLVKPEKKPSVSAQPKNSEQ